MREARANASPPHSHFNPPSTAQRLHPTSSRTIRLHEKTSARKQTLTLTYTHTIPTNTGFASTEDSQLRNQHSKLRTQATGLRTQHSGLKTQDAVQHSMNNQNPMKIIAFIVSFSFRFLFGYSKKVWQDTFSAMARLDRVRNSSETHD